MGSLIARDAEQQRDADGKFEAGGGSSAHKAGLKDSLLKTRDKIDAAFENGQLTSRAYEKQLSEIEAELAKDSGPYAIDPTTAMQGEVGRLARKQARDCLTGRYRP